ncbi:MAG: nucleotidyltransferase family protein [Nitrospira sp.]|nr:nucleotidyltransferase family protein [Nitrospira sp.]
MTESSKQSDGSETMNPKISISKSELAAFCRANGIVRLAIFGSALRDDFGPESDIDVLIEFESGRIPGLLGVASMESKLSGLFGGRKVDLRTPEDLSPYFRQDVLDTAEVHYAQG